MMLFFGPDGERPSEREITECKAKVICALCPYAPSAWSTRSSAAAWRAVALHVVWALGMGSRLMQPACAPAAIAR
jgi:hypothetical protein